MSGRLLVGEPVPALDVAATVVFRHALAGHELFGDAALAELLDDYPRDDLHVTTMGPSLAAGGWRTGRVPPMAGADLLAAVRGGHLWLNVKRLHVHSPAFRDLIASLYAELAAPAGAAPPRWRAGTLLLSSPAASVHYHADAVPNILWQIRGRKRVTVYPRHDPRLAPPAMLERICSGAADEGLPYEPWFEAAGRGLELEPGFGVAWPQNSPHRVANIAGLNVSLSTEHLTPRARRRVAVLRANRVLRRLGRPPRSAAETGFAAGAKALLATALRVAGRILGGKPISFAIPATFDVDPRSPTGFVDRPR